MAFSAMRIMTAGLLALGLTACGSGDSSTTPAAAPVLTALAPASGSTAGGTRVTLTGSNLAGASAVTFDGVAGTSLTVVSGSEVTVKTPAHAAGTVDVRITTPGGSVTLTAAYTTPRPASSPRWQAMAPPAMAVMATVARPRNWTTRAEWRSMPPATCSSPTPTTT